MYTFRQKRIMPKSFSVFEILTHLPFFHSGGIIHSLSVRFLLSDVQEKFPHLPTTPVAFEAMAILLDVDKSLSKLRLEFPPLPRVPPRPRMTGRARDMLVKSSTFH